MANFQGSEKIECRLCGWTPKGSIDVAGLLSATVGTEQEMMFHVLTAHPIETLTSDSMRNKIAPIAFNLGLQLAERLKGK